MNQKRIGAMLFTLSTCLAFVLYPWATQVTVQTPLGAYPGAVVADDLNVTWTDSAAAGLTTGVTFTITGGEILLVRHPGATHLGVGDVTFTIQSSVDSLGRYGHIAEYVISASEVAAFNFSNIQGWRVAGTVASVSCATPTLQFMVLKYR